MKKILAVVFVISLAAGTLWAQAQPRAPRRIEEGRGGQDDAQQSCSGGKHSLLRAGSAEPESAGGLQGEVHHHQGRFRRRSDARLVAARRGPLLQPGEEWIFHRRVFLPRRAWVRGAVRNQRRSQDRRRMEPRQHPGRSR